MFLFNLILLTIPVIFLMASAIIATKAYANGKSKKKTVMMQISSFVTVYSSIFSLLKITYDFSSLYPHTNELSRYIFNPSNASVYWMFCILIV